jgi:CheY-like chemotaxis protein
MPIKSILIVDDSATDRHYLSDLLAKNGYYRSRPRKARKRHSRRQRSCAPTSS